MSESDLSTLSYEDLAKLKSQAIEEMNFERAREIEFTIQERKKDDAQEALEQKKVQLEEELEAAYDDYLENLETVRETAEQRRLSIRLKVDQSFQEWKKTHMAELMVIEKEYALEILRAKERPVKEQRMMFRQAKNLAKMNKFDESIAIREQAKQAFDEEMLARRLEIDEKYDRMREQTMLHQKSDLEILKGKLQALLRVVDTEEKKQLDAQDKKYVVAIRAIQQRGVNSVTSFVKDGVQKREMTDAVNDFVIQKVEELSGVTLSSIIPLSTSPRKTMKSPAKSPRSTSVTDSV